MNCIVLSIIGFIYIGEGILLVLTIIFYGVLIFRLFDLQSTVKSDMNWTQIRSLRRGLREVSYVGRHSVKSIRISYNFWSLLCFIFIIGHFSLVAAYMGWPPGVDAINSGLLTSLLVNNQKLQTDLSPVAPSQPWFEPIGIPVMAANLAFLFNLFPGEALLLLASTIISLILMLIYSIVYAMTGSIAFSSLALFAGFYIYPATSDIRFLEKWLIGFYYNTPYPTLFGYLALLVFIACWFAVVNGHQRGRGIRRSKLSKIISVVGIIIAYTPFVILPCIYMIILYASNRIHSLRSVFIRRKTIFLGGQAKIYSFKLPNTKKALAAAVVGTLLVTVLIVITISYILLTEPEGPVSKLVERIQANAYYYSGVVLTPNIFTNLTGILTLITFGSAVFSLVKKNRSDLSMFYLLLSGFIIVSSLVGDIVNNYVWFLFHGRLFAFLMILNWIMIAIYLSDLVYSIFRKARRSGSQTHTYGLSSFSGKDIDSPQFISVVRITIVLALSSTFFLPSVISNISLEQAQLWNWIFGRQNFENDYTLFAWIAQNVNASDLIMTDYSYAARSIHSFSLKNVTTHPFPNSPSEIEKDKNNAIVWNRPTLLRDFVEKYNIKYILLDSEPYRRVPLKLVATMSTLKKHTI